VLIVDANANANADASLDAYEEADALVARRGPVGVRVADCVPVLVGDEAGGDVAAIHAGWKGVVGGVVREAMSLLGGSALVAAIGPCIGACCFEVSEDVATLIADASTRACILSRHAPGKAMIDLRIAVAHQLESLGVPRARVDQVGGCTKCDAARYYSFRRDADNAGRLIGVIVATRVA
jgi:YfiH family protein